MAKNLSEDEQKFLKKLGDRVREIRKSQNMTQQELVFHAKVHGNLVGTYIQYGTNLNLLFKS